MKYWSILLLFLFSCQNEIKTPPSHTKEQHSNSAQTTDNETIADTLIQDTIPSVPPKPESNYSPIKNAKKLKAFLAKPIDLPQFKKAMRMSNSGGYDKEPYLFQPSTAGFYYRYFVFRGCSPHGLQIVVYKEGTDVGRWENNNEQLISVDSKCQLGSLKQLNLVEKTLAEIENQFGKNYIEKDRKIIYADNGNLLILNFYRNKKVSSFKYVRTNLSIKSAEDVPKSILH